MSAAVLAGEHGGGAHDVAGEQLGCPVGVVVKRGCFQRSVLSGRVAAGVDAA